MLSFGTSWRALLNASRLKASERSLPSIFIISSSIPYYFFLLYSLFPTFSIVIFLFFLPAISALCYYYSLSSALSSLR
jgi:hypothetical protein